MNEREYHDQHYEAEAAKIQNTAVFTRVHDRVSRQFLRATRAAPHQRILSLGCGDGSIELRLAPHVAQIVGLDISSVAIERARAKAASAGLGNVSFAVFEGDSASMAGLGKFDVVAAFAFLHHLDEAAIRDTLLAARKALRPGGVFYSADPSRRRLIGHFAGLVRSAYDRYHSPDERELDPYALAALCSQAGFEPVIGYVDYFLGPLAWLAPGTPAWLASALEALDNAALGVPLLRRYASSFSLLARTSA
ncbi:MAG: class I SAM-dependent methyltransferase [Burkholderiales bacterium]